MAPEVCPNCGAEVPPEARACPECGSCEETGWSEEAKASGLDLPDEEFNYQEFVQREFEGESAKPRGIDWVWWMVALLVVVVMVWLALRR